MYGSHDNDTRCSFEALESMLQGTKLITLTQSFRTTASGANYTSITSTFLTSVSLIKYSIQRSKSVRSNKGDDSLISIVGSRVVVDSVSSSRDGVGCEIIVGDRRVELLGRVNLGHVGT